MSQLKKGALLNYVTIILTNVVGLILTPFIINSLGKNEYGVYTTVGALVGTLSLLDFGLNNTIIRFVAKYKAEKDKKGEENFLATVLLLYFIISIIIVLVGLFFYNQVDSYFTKMSIEEIRIVKEMYVILIMNLAISLPGGIFTGICIGYENFVFPKSLNIIRYILRSVTVIGVLFIGGKSISLVIIDTVFNILIVIITAYYVLKTLKIRFKLHSFSTRFIKEIAGYSVWIFISSLVGIFQWKAGHWVLGRMSTTDSLSIYAIGITLGTYYGTFSSAISGLFLPKAIQMSVGNATGEQLTDMMVKIGRLSFIVLAYILGAFLLYGKQFVNLWVGEGLGEKGSYESWVIALIIMIAYTLPLIQSFGVSILEAKNKTAFKAILYLVFLIIGTIIGALLVKPYGVIGMVIGTVIGWMIVQNIMNFYYHYSTNLNILRFFKEISHKIILVIIVVLIIGYFINYLPGTNWLNFVLKGVLYTLVFSFLMYLFGMLDSEKKIFTENFKNLLKKVKKSK